MVRRSKQPIDEARFYRPRYLPGVELVSVAYQDRRFPEHSHNECVIGAVTAGAEALVVNGREHVVAAGAVLRLLPTEAHYNMVLGPETLRYNVFYIPRLTMETLGSGEGSGLFFANRVTNDTEIFKTACSVHALLLDNDVGRLEQESALAKLVQANMPQPSPQIKTGVRHGAATMMRLFIEERFMESFGLDDLSRLTNLSTFHLLRVFKATFGLTPLAFRNQRRVAEARLRLLDGEPIAQVAIDLGYADQSHLTRQFNRLVGTSPGRYARQ